MLIPRTVVFGMDEKQNFVKVWLPVINYEDTYIISNHAEIHNKKTNHVMKYHLRNGYYAVCLCKNNLKHTYNVHKLVAQHFLQPSDDPHANTVNHIDGDKLNNHSWNLEFVTPKQNTQHALTNNLTTPHFKKVGQFLNGTMVQAFNSIKEASETTGILDKHIPSVCRKRKRSAGGYEWKYLDNNLQPIDFIPINFESVQGAIINGYPNYKITPNAQVFSRARQDYLVPKILQSGYEIVKLCNNGVNKDFYVHALVNTYYPNVNSQVHLNDGNMIQS